MTKYGLISDINSDLESLEKVLEIFKFKGVDEIVCLGDVLNGTEKAEEIVKILKDKNIQTVLGDSDKESLKHLKMTKFSTSLDG